MNVLVQRLISWYQENKRDLPWREHPDPYAVWVSEIMLQQTRVETVIPYYQRWLVLFPTVQALAEADEQTVLNAWEGLGYYTRARNLHKAAKIVHQNYAGKLPPSPSLLQKLPGIGRYTAGAIASLAFKKDIAALDGNLKRVLARLFDVKTPLGTTETEKKLWQLAETHLPAGFAAQYNQALMDLGAMVCKPRLPACSACPLADLCISCQLGVQEERPVRKPRHQVPHYTVTAAVISKKQQVLLAQRPPEGLLAGMWEFPGGKREHDESLQACLQREIKEELAVDVLVGEKIGIYRHAYTHFKITLHAFHCRLTNGKPRAVEAQALRWVKIAELAEYPMGKVDREIAAWLQANHL